MSDAPAAPEFPYRFAIIAFVVSILIGVAVFYYGVHGQIGAGIP